MRPPKVVLFVHAVYGERRIRVDDTTPMVDYLSAGGRRLRIYDVPAGFKALVTLSSGIWLGHGQTMREALRNAVASAHDYVPVTPVAVVIADCLPGINTYDASNPPFDEVAIL